MIANAARSADYMMDLKFLTCHLCLFADARATCLFASDEEVKTWYNQLPPMVVQNYLDYHVQTHGYAPCPADMITELYKKHPLRSRLASEKRRRTDYIIIDDDDEGDDR